MNLDVSTVFAQSNRAAVGIAALNKISTSEQLTLVSKVFCAARSVFHFFSWMAANTIKFISRDKLLSNLSRYEYDCFREQSQKAGYLGIGVFLAAACLVAFYLNRASKEAKPMSDSPEMLPLARHQEEKKEERAEEGEHQAPALPNNSEDQLEQGAESASDIIRFYFNFSVGSLFLGKPQFDYDELPILSCKEPEKTTIEDLGEHSVMKSNIDNYHQYLFISIIHQTDTDSTNSLLIIKITLNHHDTMKNAIAEPLLGLLSSSSSQAMFKMNTFLLTTDPFSTTTIARLLNGEQVKASSGGTYQVKNIRTVTPKDVSEYERLAKERSEQAVLKIFSEVSAITKKEEEKKTPSSQSKKSEKPKKPSEAVKPVLTQQQLQTIFINFFAQEFDHTKFVFKSIARCGAKNPYEMTANELKAECVRGSLENGNPYVVMALTDELKIPPDPGKKGKYKKIEPDYFLIIEASLESEQKSHNPLSTPSKFTFALKNLSQNTTEPLTLEYEKFKDLLKKGKIGDLVAEKNLVVLK